MKAIGIVIKTKNDVATVVSERRSACSSCHNCEAKGACHAELVFGNQSESVEVCALNKIGAKVGDRVELEGSTKETLTASFLLFVLPFIATVLFYFSFTNFITDVRYVPLILIAVYAFSFFVAGKLLNHIFSKKLTTFIVRILEECKEDLEAE